MKKICVIGAGSWGTALALTAHRAGQLVTLFPRCDQQANVINKERENKAYLPGVFLPKNIFVTADLKKLEEADIVLQVTPAQSLKETCLQVQKYLPSKAPWVICAKGVFKGEGSPQLLAEVSQTYLPNPVAILSGPSFADEVGKNLPTAVTIASTEKEVAHFVASSLHHSRFRCYVSDDPVGVQIAGSIKNVLAIACGIVRGKGLGNNAAAALISRGLTEMRRLALVLQGKGDTFLGLAGVGDVTLTCSSTQSRNMRLGLALSQNGHKATQVLKEMSYIAEGVPTAAAVYQLSQKLAVPMPLCQAVYSILYEGVSVDEAIEAILSRPSEMEFS